MPKIHAILRWKGTFQSRSDETTFLRQLQKEVTDTVERVADDYPGLRTRFELEGSGVEPDDDKEASG